MQKTLGFPSSVRLNSSREFHNVLTCADLRRGGEALRMAAVANRMHTARLGLIVGRRAVPRAHERNRIKRVIREFFRTRRGKLAEMDIVIQVLASRSNEELRRDLARLFEDVERS